MRRIAPAMIALALMGCAPKIDLDAGFQSAYAQAKAGQWDTAMSGTKSVLLRYPAAGAAHFLLGQCYLYGEPVNLTQSRGELRTAWEIFKRDKSYAPWENELTPDEYELKLHTVMAAMHMRWISEALAQHIPFSIIRERIENGLKPQIWKGLKLKPDDPYMNNLDAAVKEMLKEAGTVRRPAPSLTPNTKT